MTQVLLSTTAPFLLVPHDAPRVLTPTSTAAPTNLTLLLTHSPAADTVTLTLSDLSTRLLLLRYTLTAARYAPLRESQSLLIDFAAFPIHLCDLLQRVITAEDYIATLRLDQNNSSTDNDRPATLTIIQTSAVKSITHIEIDLVHASHEEVVSAVAARAREAEVADAKVTQLEQTLARERARAREEMTKSTSRSEQLENTIIQLRHELTKANENAERADELQDECETLRKCVSERDKELAQSKTEISNMSGLNEECERLRNAFDESERNNEKIEDDRKQIEKERDDILRQLNEMTKQRDDQSREIIRGNDIIERLQNEVRTQRAKTKVKSNVLIRQEQNVRKLESRVSELERDVRKARDRAALLEVEKDGLNERVKAATKKLEENATVLASDQQVIAYLNRELNERALSADITGNSGVGAAGATTRQSRRRQAAANIGVASQS